ncbi:Lectin BRA-2 [Amphibalanus amphitrite]|uniref:Lectin BRA-2 n=1 Tax=Amphibalanus amphitrite TaxID=1232801 RepID=A0A6A4V095_AMPAM|nr:Lectin BRA-2 [Amphibalanus amphitrite]
MLLLITFSVVCVPLLSGASTADPAPDRLASHLVSGLAQVCLSEARSSLCGPVERLETQLEELLEKMQTLPPSCPPGWRQQGSSCFFIPPQTATWLQAHHYCALLDGRARLGSVHPATHGLVRELVAASDSDRVWIGLIQLPGRRWGWVDGSPLDYTDWRRGGPTFRGEHCAHIYGPRNSLEGWNDTECDRDRHFLCEIRLDLQ